jgi:hypothetical protein
MENLLLVNELRSGGDETSDAHVNLVLEVEDQNLYLNVVERMQITLSQQ